MVKRTNLDLRSWWGLALRGFTAVLLGLVLTLAARAEDGRLAQAQQLLDQGQAAQALKLLETVLEQGKPSAEALLLRSTAYIVLGNTQQGFKELERALKLDPKLRQGWLNLAGMEIAEGRLDAASSALLKAREIDPQAADSYLNLGAVAILQGKIELATENFKSYLELEEAQGEANYLVAANYALGNQEELAVEHLGRAIAQDERLRLRARTDDRFAALAGPRYAQLLQTDSYTPPPDAYQVAAAFNMPYSRPQPQLLYAVLDALKEVGERFDPKIEATPEWALIWGELRIKVWNQANGTGVVSLSAPADRLSADAWHRRTQALFSAIHQQLAAAERAADPLRPR